MTGPEVLDVSDGQRRVLGHLTDCAWHRTSRTGSGDTILATVAAALWRAGMAERRGASRTVKPSNPGFEYRITPKGQRAYGVAMLKAVGLPSCPTSPTGHPNACRCHH